MRSDAIALFKSLELCNAFRAMGKINIEPSQAILVRESVLKALKDGEVMWGEDFSYSLTAEEHSFIVEANRLFQVSQKTGDFREMMELNDKLILANAQEIKDFLVGVFSFDTAPILNYVKDVIFVGEKDAATTTTTATATA